MFSPCPFSLSRSRSLPVLILAMLSVALISSPSGAQVVNNGKDSGSDINLMDPIPPTTRATRIAIPTFEAKGSRGPLKPGFFYEIIYRDLEWFSNFARVKNQTFVEQNHRADKKTGKIDFGKWQRLDCDFVLKGEFTVRDGKIVAECYLYDILYGTRVFGLRYNNYAMDKPRELAHRISDDIVKSVVLDGEGIANTQIVYVSRQPGSSNKEVFLMDADGHNQRALTNNKSIATMPCWGKNGTEIYFTSYHDTNPDLYLFQIESGIQTCISRWPGLNFVPDWCSRTERIVLTLAKDGNSEIYTMNRDGHKRGHKRLTYTPSIDTSPSWNPAGNSIVFNSDRSGYRHVYTMNKDGGDIRQLTVKGTYNAAPVWSPKGDRIAFHSREHGIYNIFTMNIDGSGLRRLTERSDNNEDPGWAADGKHLVFSSNRTGEYQIYIMRDDGSNQHRLTSKGMNHSPQWSPSPYK